MKLQSFFDVPYPEEARWVVVGGVRSCYWRKGRGETVLLLSAAGRGLLHYRDLVEQISGACTIACDLPGWGKAEKPDLPYDFPFYLRWIQDLLDALDVRSCHVVGNSMGGQLAAGLAAAIPHRIRSVTMIGVPGNQSCWNRLILRLLVNELTIANIRPWQFRAAVKKNFYRWPARAEEIVAKGVALSRGPEWPAYARCLARNLRAAARFDLESCLRRVECPALFLWGREDAVCPVSGIPALAALVPGSEIEVLPECGHFPPIEKPTQSAAILEGFWRDS